MRNINLVRVVMAGFAIAIAAPVVATLTSKTAAASGYVLMSGRDGSVDCVPGNGADC